jgi:hypothetical protein
MYFYESHTIISIYMKDILLSFLIQLLVDHVASEQANQEILY